MKKLVIFKDGEFKEERGAWWCCWGYADMLDVYRGIRD